MKKLLWIGLAAVCLTACQPKGEKKEQQQEPAPQQEQVVKEMSVAEKEVKACLEGYEARVDSIATIDGLVEMQKSMQEELKNIVNKYTEADQNAIKNNEELKVLNDTLKEKVNAKTKKLMDENL